MRRPWGLVLAGVLVLAAGVGCTHSHQTCGKGCPAPPPPPPEVALPVVQRANLESVFHGLPALLPDEALPGSAAEAVETYYALTPRDCQCLAVRCCAVANLLDRERQIAAELGKSKCLIGCTKANMGSSFLQETTESAAHEARNLQSGAALELYYRLAEAEAGIDLLQLTLDELDKTLAKSKELREKMLITDEDYEKLVRQRLKSLGDRTELQMNIETLNVELGKLICIRVCPGRAHLWPLVELEAGCPLIDCDAAVRVALQSRGELQILRAVQRDLNLLTLAAARQTLKSVNVLLGSAEPRCKCPQLQALLEMICKEGPYSRELEIRRQQLSQRIAEREQAIASDVLQEVKHVYRRCQTATLARKRSDSLAKQVTEVEERERKNLATSADVTKVRLEWLQARGDVVKEIAARERARAKLKQHQGVLPLECPQPSPAAPCCNH